MKRYTWTIPVLPPLDFIKVSVVAETVNDARHEIAKDAPREFDGHAPYWMEHALKGIEKEPNIENIYDVQWTIISPP